MTRQWWAAVGMFLAVLGWHGQAQAACTNHTYTDMRTGRIISCQTCCYSGHCNTTCF